MAGIVRFALLLFAAADAYTPTLPASRSGVASQRSVGGRARTALIRAGLFDGLFAETEEQKARKAAEEARKEADFQAQQEMLKRRRNPAAMAEYMADVEAKRKEAMEANMELETLQSGQGGGDKLEAWQKMREEGKINVFDKEREAGDRSLGGEGLLPDRIDESMPYIDDGYVDESAPDVMESFKKLFGGK